MKAEENGYTKIQKFFWVLSGSEIHILEKCKSDYNRHATTGAILLMTATVAFFAGSYAGWYFSYDYQTGQRSLAAAITFGFLWGCLIYTIDRMMVLSIKKDPHIPKEQQPFWSILAPRVIIGIMIAFFISIPLEILIFSENIDRQMEINNTKDVIQAVKDKNTIYNTEQRGASVLIDSSKVLDF